MKRIRRWVVMILSATLLLSGCASFNTTQKGASMHAATGKVAGNTGLGAIISAAVGGSAGVVIGHKMDQLAEEIKKRVPDAKVDRVGEGIVVELNGDLLFSSDRSNLLADTKTNLNKLVKTLDGYPDTEMEVQGHTDSKGSESYNQNLSESRAHAASEYLYNNGIANDRIRTKGFGGNMPKYDNNTKDGRSQNRRIEFLITANAKMKAAAQKETAKPFPSDQSSIKNTGFGLVVGYRF